MSFSQLRREASDQLKENRKDFSKVVLIHSAVTAGISFVVILFTWLTQHTGSDHGISSVDQQILLTTVQVMLQLISTVALPFWNAGLILCALRTVRGERNTALTLTEGFRRWSVIASALLIQGVNYFALSMLSSLASSTFLSTIPLPPAFQEAILDYAEAPVYPPPDNIMIFLNIYMAVNLVSLLILLIPRLYLHRLVPYKIMDSDEPCNGLQAVMYSRILMKGNRRKLLILDLSFGWFYLLEFAISAVAIGDLLMAALGISLPIGQEITGLLFPIAALLLRLLLHWWAKPKLMITYTLFYKTVLDESSKEPVPPQPKRRPWKY